MPYSLRVTLLLTILICLGISERLNAISSPVTDEHIRIINTLFKNQGIINAKAALDKYGRIELKGSYKNNNEVRQAFSLAQSVVGVKWVSPVEPENIEIQERDKKFSNLFLKVLAKDQSELGGPPGVIVHRYALIIGISRFLNLPEQNQLQFPAKDATDFYNYLISSSKGNFTPNNVTLLTNDKATRANIINAMNDIKSNAKKNDLVVLYFSSHGTPPDPYGVVHILAYDTVPKRSEIWDTAITKDMLADFIQNQKAQRLVVIIDACFSEGVYKNIPGFLPEGGKAFMMDETEGRGLSQSQMSKDLLGAKDIVLDDEPYSSSKGLEMNMYGKILLSASSANEKSWESDKIHNGYFTYYLLQGLSRYGDVRESFSYLKPKVLESTIEEKGTPQHPQIVFSNKDANIQISNPSNL